MDETPNLKLPYILPAQSQKHVTHNEALRALDAVVQLTVADKDLSAPPGSPAEGSRYIVGSSPTGAWAGRATDIAAYQDAAWAFYAPAEGWLSWVADEDTLYAFNGAGWIPAPGGGGGGGGSVNPVSHVGVNATADATNRLSVSSPASLFNHEGAGHQLKINKDAAADTASVLFQSGFSGRAEFGLAGDDDFHVKVSPDGSAWHEALVVNRSTGKVSLPNTRVRDVLAANRTYYVRTDGSNSNSGLANTSGGAFLTIQKAIDTAASLDLSVYDVTIQVGAGTYTTSAGNVCKQCVGAGQVTIVGDESTPANVILTTNGVMGSADALFISQGISTQYNIRGFQLGSTATGSIFGLYASRGSLMTFQSIAIDAGISTHHLRADDGGILFASGNWSVSAGAASHVVSARGGIIIGASRTVTLSGTPAFSGGFCNVSQCGVATMQGMTLSGSATGVRYSATLNAVIQTGGGGANYFPGNSAGTTATGGQYA
jgi:hypothetical protein